MDPVADCNASLENIGSVRAEFGVTGFGTMLTHAGTRTNERTAERVGAGSTQLGTDTEMAIEPAVRGRVPVHRGRLNRHTVKFGLWSTGRWISRQE